LGDADLIVTLFSLEHGKVRGVAPSARRSLRRFGGAFGPLTRVRAGWVEKDGRELHRIDEAETLRSYVAMQARPEVQAACAVLAEVTDAFAREGQGEPDVFRLLGAACDAIDAGADPIGTVRYFEFWMLRLHGLLPEVARCDACGEPLPADRSPRVGATGSVHCSGCDDALPERGRALGRRERAFLDRARRSAPGDMSPDGTAVRPGGALEALLRGALESYAERRFRAYRHLAAAVANTETGGRG
jgi:DNA repair protein RecO (recombination protein O)